MQHLYASHYTELTPLKKGELPDHKDIIARSQLLREAGLHAREEIWVKDVGYTLTYEGTKKLTPAEEEILCVRSYEKPNHNIPSK